jgi:NitT/TauT family transport system substrate-binding protein
MNDRRESLGRREFVSGLALLGTTALYGFLPEPTAAEPPPETTRIRLIKIPIYGNCLAPLYVAEELLQGEGFTKAPAHGPLARGSAGAAPFH